MMRNLRKLSSLILLLIAFVAFLVLFQPAIAQAKDPFADACATPGAGAQSSVCKSSGQTTNPLIGPNGTLTRAANVLAIVGGVMVVIVIIIGGIKYITSNGDSSQTASAKNTIIYGLVGLIVIVLARGIVGFAITRIQ